MLSIVMIDMLVAWAKSLDVIYVHVHTMFKTMDKESYIVYMEYTA